MLRRRADDVDLANAAGLAALLDLDPAESGEAAVHLEHQDIARIEPRLREPRTEVIERPGALLRMPGEDAVVQRKPCGVVVARHERAQPRARRRIDARDVADVPMQVQQPGRYVVTGRIDDANGRPFALVSFNEELGAGPQQIRLQVFGKLLRDAQPTFPLSLRDVDAFLLKPDAFPDRSLMPRRDGLVYQTRSYPLVAFSNAEWASAERQRHLDEYRKDVGEAEHHLHSLGP